MKSYIIKELNFKDGLDEDNYARIYISKKFLISIKLYKRGTLTNYVNLYIKESGRIHISEIIGEGDIPFEIKNKNLLDYLLKDYENFLLEKVIDNNDPNYRSTCVLYKNNEYDVITYNSFVIKSEYYPNLDLQNDFIRDDKIMNTIAIKKITKKDDYDFYEEDDKIYQKEIKKLTLKD